MRMFQENISGECFKRKFQENVSRECFKRMFSMLISFNLNN